VSASYGDGMDTETERQGLSAGVLAGWYAAGCGLVIFGLVFYLVTSPFYAAVCGWTPAGMPGPLSWSTVLVGALVAGAAARARYRLRRASQWASR
jgi:hypothetical protein